MAYFAKLNSNNEVVDVLSVHNNELKDFNGIEQEQLGIDFLKNLFKTNDVWKKTSFNTYGGVYYNTDPITGIRVLNEDQSKAFRKNHAGIGYTYDENKDAFIPPKPFNSWVLNETTCLWEAPIPYPTDGQYYSWNEENQNWTLQNI
jgi:hypothetical protein